MHHAHLRKLLVTMNDFTVDIDDYVLERLKKRAQQNGRTLNDEVLKILEESTKSDQSPAS